MNSEKEFGFWVIPFVLLTILGLLLTLGIFGNSDLVHLVGASSILVAGGIELYASRGNSRRAKYGIIFLIIGIWRIIKVVF